MQAGMHMRYIYGQKVQYLVFEAPPSPPLLTYQETHEETIGFHYENKGGQRKVSAKSCLMQYLHDRLCISAALL